MSDRFIKNASYSNADLPNITKEFHSWETLMHWVEYNIKKYSNLKKIKIANTYENREIFVLKISTGIKNTAVFLMGGEEGKDWLTPAVLLNFVSYILEQKQNVDLLIKHYDLYILPMMNPDGYEYSTTKVNIQLNSFCYNYFIW